MMTGLCSPLPERFIIKRSHMAAGQHQALPKLSTSQQTDPLALDHHHTFNLQYAFRSLIDSLCFLGPCRLWTQEGGARST